MIRGDHPQSPCDYSNSSNKQKKIILDQCQVHLLSIDLEVIYFWKIMKNFQNDYAITRNAIASILEEQPSDTTGKLKASLKSLLRISKQKDSLNAVEQTSIREIIQFHVNQIKSKDQLDYQGLRFFNPNVTYLLTKFLDSIKPS